MRINQVVIVQLFWSYGGQALRAVLQFGLGIAFARLLGPEPYGIMTAALMPIGLGLIMSEGGLGTGIIRQAQDDSEFVSSCLAHQFRVGTYASLVCMALSYPVSVHLVCNPPAFLPMAALSSLLLIGNYTAVPQSILRKRMEFKALNIASIVSYVVAYGVFGAPLAYYGQGVWALVTALIMQNVINLTLVMRFSRLRYSWTGGAISSDLQGFSRKILIANLLNWYTSIIETVAISRNLGSLSLGAYNRLQVISTHLGAQLHQPFQQVAYADNCREDFSAADCRSRFDKSLCFLAAIYAPFLALECAAPEFVIYITLGEKWTGNGMLVSLLATSSFFTGVNALVSATLYSLRRPNADIWLLAPFCILCSVFVYYGSFVSILMVGLAGTVLLAVRAVTGIIIIDRILKHATGGTPAPLPATDG
jgi:PST family polysaccharide transporter